MRDRLAHEVVAGKRVAGDPGTSVCALPKNRHERVCFAQKPIAATKMAHVGNPTTTARRHEQVLFFALERAAALVSGHTLACRPRRGTGIWNMSLGAGSRLKNFDAILGTTRLVAPLRSRGGRQSLLRPYGTGQLRARVGRRYQLLRLTLETKPAVRGMSSAPLYLNEPTSIAAISRPVSAKRWGNRPASLRIAEY